MAEAGAAGYEVLTSLRQSDRLFNVDLDSGLGRKPSAVPAHLSQVLYLPQHSMLNLCVYDAQAPYQYAINTSPLGGEHLVGKALMGSRLFKTRLNTMDGAAVMQNGEPRYVVSLDVERIRDGGDISATVRAKAASEQARATPEITIMLPMLADVFGLGVAKTEDHQSQLIDISTRYPVRRVRTNAGLIRFPYFSFRLDEGSGSASVGYEWQMHPLDHGTLRYTLFRIHGQGSAQQQQQQQQQQEEEEEEEQGHENGDIVAVYHHIGHDGSLFQPTSEGVLLLPALEAQTRRLLEAITVASLVGLLWRIRGMEIWRDEGDDDGAQKKRSFVQRIFGGRKT
ncbi:hypothetical protein E4U55_000885 [Claviceps digitariae]|nr:hypothetical protein E4U55_000885 [Claviceps digitariae]